MREAAETASVARVSDDATRAQALSRLATRCARKGQAIARDLLRDPAEAEDVVQESLARACASWERLRDPDALEGWFYRVLTNLCMRILRRRRLSLAMRRLWSPGLLVRQGGGEGEDDVDEYDLIDEQPGTDDSLNNAAEQRRMLRAVEALPVMQRTALVLRYGHDHSVGEIATLLEVGEGTVKTHLVRGLQRLRELVGADARGPGQTAESNQTRRAR